MTSGYIRVLAGLSFLMCVAGCVTAFDASGAKLEFYGILYGEKGQITQLFWPKAVAPPPKGWIEAEDWSDRYQSLFLFENGDRSKDKPLMYLQVKRSEENRTPEKYIENVEKTWKEMNRDSTIERLADFERKNKPTFKIFLYRNPSIPEQALELTAFTQDVDAAHPERTYFFQAVLQSPDREGLERTKAAFYEFLANL